MSLQIATNHEIIIDGRATGYGLSQEAHGTEVRRGAEVLALPCSRYVTGTDSSYGLKPGQGSRADLEVHMRAALGL